MAYIGKEPIIGNFQKCDAISVVNGQAAYTLQVSSTNVVPESSQHCLVSLNGILQKNGGSNPSFTVSGSTLTFASNLATGDVIDFVILLGNVLDLGTPSDGTVTNAKLASDLISGETDIGGAIADADLFLMDDGAGGTLRKTAASRIKTYIGGGLSVADQWRLTTSFQGDADPIASNLEQVDQTAEGTIGSAMTESSGIFTFPSTGVYLVGFQVLFYLGDDNSRYNHFKIQATTNNSSYADIGYGSTFLQSTDGVNSYSNGYIQSLIDVTDTSNVKVRFKIDIVSASIAVNVQGSSTDTQTGMTFLRLGDT